MSTNTHIYIRIFLKHHIIFMITEQKYKINSSITIIKFKIIWLKKIFNLYQSIYLFRKGIKSITIILYFSILISTEG